MHPRALVEGQLAQRRPADLAGVVEHAAEIEPAAAGARDRLPSMALAMSARLPPSPGTQLVAGVIEELLGSSLRPL